MGVGLCVIHVCVWVYVIHVCVWVYLCMGVCVIQVCVYGCMCMGTNPDMHVIKYMATRFKTVAIVMISLFEKVVFNSFTGNRAILRRRCYTKATLFTKAVNTLQSTAY